MSELESLKEQGEKQTNKKHSASQHSSKLKEPLRINLAPNTFSLCF